MAKTKLLLVGEPRYLLDETQAKIAGIEIDIALNMRGHGRDMVYSVRYRAFFLTAACNHSPARHLVLAGPLSVNSPQNERICNARTVVRCPPRCVIAPASIG